MSEENLSTTGNETSPETSSQEQVADASQDVGKETQGETTQAKEKADENHPANLGRKVKHLTEQLENLQTNFSLLIEEMRSSRKAEPPAKGDVVANNYDDGLFEQLSSIEPPPVETIITAKDQIAIQQWEARAKGKLFARMQGAYERDYYAQLDTKEMKEMGGELHARIVQMVTDPRDKGEKYNKRKSGNGRFDAEFNYTRALKDLLAGKGGDLSTFNQQKADGTGVTTSTTQDKKTVQTVKLSAAAQEYADYLGMSAEDRASAMGRKLGVASR